MSDASAETEELAGQLREAIKEILRVRGGVEFKPRGSLEPNAKVIDDQRTWD